MDFFTHIDYIGVLHVELYVQMNIMGKNSILITTC
jgi:hypothetical protein